MRKTTHLMKFLLHRSFKEVSNRFESSIFGFLQTVFIIQEIHHFHYLIISFFFFSHQFVREASKITFHSSDFKIKSCLKLSKC